MNRTKTACIVWAGIGVFCVVFSVVYLHFSYGVTSPFMVGLAAGPLVLGAGVQWSLTHAGKSLESDLAFGAYQALVATITVGCLVAGILGIADAPSGLLWLFPALALGCLGASFAGLAKS